LIISECVKYSEQAGRTHEAWIPGLEEGWQSTLEVEKKETSQKKSRS